MGRLVTNIILILLLAIAIYVGIAVVNSNDRLYFSNQKILEEIESLRKEVKYRPQAVNKIVIVITIIFTHEPTLSISMVGKKAFIISPNICPKHQIIPPTKNA